MIISVGVDIVEVYRIQETLTRTPRFAERVFTDIERAYCESRGATKFQSYAGRYAAKEAFLKAIKTGWRGEIAWKDIEIVNDELGAPTLTVSGKAREIADSLGAEKIDISISHTEKDAIAFVTLSK